MMSARPIGLALVVLAVGALALVWLRADGRRDSELVEACAADGAERPSSRADLRAAERTTSSSTKQGAAERPVPAENVAEGAKPATTHADELVKCVLYGKILDTDGHAVRVREPYVSLLSADNESRGTSTSEGGDYSLAGLAPGAWTLQWGAAGYRKETETVELGADTPFVRRDLVLSKTVVLAVRVVTPSGELFNVALSARSKLHSQSPVRPVPVATLEAPGESIDVQDARQERFGVGIYDESGPLAVEAGTGVLELSVDLPVFVSLVAGPRVLATQRVEPGASAVTFVLDPDTLLTQQGKVRARFVDAETGEPLSGMIQAEDEVSSVRDGVWEAVLTPGKHEYRFEASGTARVPLHLELEPGQELDLGEIRVPRELTIEGRLLDDEGRPVRGQLEIGAFDERGGVRFDERRIFTADERGHYQINSLLAARYAVRTQADIEIELTADGKPPLLWVAGPAPVSTLGGSVTGFDLRCVKAGVLELKGGHALPPESRCKLLDERGELERYDGFYPGSTPRFALAPGNYTLVLCAKDWSERSRRAVVVGAGLTTVDVAE